MNRRMISFTIGRILLAEAALMIPSVIVGVINKEPETWAFLPAIGMLLAIGGIASFRKPERRM